MKNLVIGVCCLSVVLMATPYSFGESEDDLKKALQGLESKKIDVDSLYHVFTLLDYAPNAVVHTSVLHVCGAGLLYIGQHERYRAIKPRIAKIGEFEKEILFPCHACQGAGQVSSTCTTCKGSGKCSNGVCLSCHICKGNQSHYNCRHGKVKRSGFDGKDTYENCGLCRGTHKCQKCDGTGSLSEPCEACEGNGGTFSKSMAFAKYKESVAAALAAFGTPPEPEQLNPVPAITN